MNYRIDKNYTDGAEKFVLQKEEKFYDGTKVFNKDGRKYNHLKDLEKAIIDLGIKNNGSTLVFSDKISFTDIATLTEDLKIPLSNVKMECVEQKVLQE